jgi:hypothetical protein
MYWSVHNTVRVTRCVDDGRRGMSTTDDAICRRKATRYVDDGRRDVSTTGDAMCRRRATRYVDAGRCDAGNNLNRVQNPVGVTGTGQLHQRLRLLRRDAARHVSTMARTISANPAGTTSCITAGEAKATATFGVASRYVEAKSEAHASPQSGDASRRPAFNCGVAGRYAERKIQTGVAGCYVERMAPTLCLLRRDAARHVFTMVRTIPANPAGTTSCITAGEAKAPAPFGVACRYVAAISEAPASPPSG